MEVAHPAARDGSRRRTGREDDQGLAVDVGGSSGSLIGALLAANAELRDGLFRHSVAEEFLTDIAA